jgi:outer membrane protein assembly factor BamB
MMENAVAPDKRTTHVLRVLWRLACCSLIIPLLMLSGCALPWTTATAPHTTISPTPESALARRTVYWSQGNYLWAFRASDGQVRWKVGDWSGSLPNSGNIYDSGPGLPTLIDGTIYATAIDDGYATPEMYAIDPRSGAIRWHTVLLDCLQYAAPVVQDGVIYLTTSGHYSGSFPCEQHGYVLALRASDGVMLWRAALEPVISVAPVITNGVLTVVSDNYPTEPAATYLNAFRASDGARIWRKQAGLRNVSLIGDAGTILVTTDALGGPHPQRFIEAYQASDGRQLWTIAVNSGYDPLAGAGMTNGMIYLNPGGDITALRASDGKVMWTFAEGTRSFSTPLLRDGRLYLGVGTELLTLDASTGALLRAYAIFEPPIDPEYEWYAWSRPAITNGTIYFSAAYGSIGCCHPGNGSILHALDLQSGRLLWSQLERPGDPTSVPILD